MKAALQLLDQTIENAPPAERAGLIVQLAARLATLGAALSSAAPSQVTSEPQPDTNLDVEEAARRLGVSADWLYRQKALPFRLNVGRRVLFSARGLETYRARRMGRS
jgi:hypothetical protein